MILTPKLKCKSYLHIKLPFKKNQESSTAKVHPSSTCHTIPSESSGVTPKNEEEAPVLPQITTKILIQNYSLGKTWK